MQIFSSDSEISLYLLVFQIVQIARAHFILLKNPLVQNISMQTDLEVVWLPLLIAYENLKEHPKYEETIL